jgi:hypothetical protein
MSQTPSLCWKRRRKKKFLTRECHLLHEQHGNGKNNFNWFLVQAFFFNKKIIFLKLNVGKYFADKKIYKKIFNCSAEIMYGVFLFCMTKSIIRNCTGIFLSVESKIFFCQFHTNCFHKKIYFAYLSLENFFKTPTDLIFAIIQNHWSTLKISLLIYYQNGWEHDSLQESIFFQKPPWVQSLNNHSQTVDMQVRFLPRQKKIDGSQLIYHTVDLEKEIKQITNS